MSADWVCIALVAVFWGGYPLVARLSSFGGPWGSLLLGSVAILPIAGTALAAGGWERPARGDLWPLLVAGLMQGVGLMAFVRVATGKLEASVAIPVSDVAMLIVTTVGAILFFQETLTALAFLVVGILLLRPA